MHKWMVLAQYVPWFVVHQCRGCKQIRSRVADTFAEANRKPPVDGCPAAGR